MYATVIIFPTELGDIYIYIYITFNNIWIPCLKIEHAVFRVRL